MADECSGRPVAEFLKELAEPLADLKQRLGDADPCEQDEQYLLRLLLACDGLSEQAEIAAKGARENRKLFAEVIEKARKHEPLPQEAIIREHICYGRWHYPASEVEQSKGAAELWPPILVTRSGHSNLAACMEKVSEEQVVEYLLWERLQIFEEAIEATRKTGRLMMMSSINDLAEASLLFSREPRFFSAVGKVSKIGLGLAPFLSRKHVMINSGVVFSALFAIAKLFMPQRVLDKVALVSPEQLPGLLSVPHAAMPEFLGGTCPVPQESSLYVAPEEKLDVLDITGDM